MAAKRETTRAASPSAFADRRPAAADQIEAGCRGSSRHVRLTSLRSRPVTGGRPVPAWPSVFRPRPAGRGIVSPKRVSCSRPIPAAVSGRRSVAIGDADPAMHDPASTASGLEADILARYDAGLYLDAYRHLEQRGGLEALGGPSGRALAGRLVANLGAERWAAAIHLRAWRRTPEADGLGYFFGLALARRRGPVHALHAFDRMLGAELTPTGLSDIASGRAQMLATLRDFGEAEAALARGFAATPERPWLFVVRGDVLRMQDRIADAEAALRAALDRRPWYRPAVQRLADTLLNRNKIDEARALLVAACERLQSGSLLVSLAQLDRDLGHPESAQRWLDAALDMLPLRQADRQARTALLSLAASLACDTGDLEAAIQLGVQADSAFDKAVVGNLRQFGATGRRVLLDVGFTLQHDSTCVPATLATLIEYWGGTASQQEIAAAICYDGTPAHAERAWLEEQGFFCREFTLTWEATLALIDAGLPFCQTLTGYGAGHVQAVIGYDSRRGVIVYRDPGERHAGEVLGRELIEALRSNGPRGLVFVPAASRGLVEAIDLPDHELWTRLAEIARALAEHRRDDAAASCAAMEAMEPDHRLTVHARARIAAYDGDLPALAALTDRLLAEFPDDQNQWSVKLQVLRQLGSRADRLAALEQLCDKSTCAPVYRHQLLEELMSDPRALPRVDAMLRRCMRVNPLDPETLGLQARRAWIARDRAAALTWSRYAACVDVRTEDRWQVYFSAACALNRSAEALSLLEDRFRRFRGLSAGPGCSLVEALDQRMQQTRAIQVLDAALEARPADGDLLLFASAFNLRLDRPRPAAEFLERARGKCHPAAWLACAARIARHENRRQDAFDHLAESLRWHPLNIATHRSVVELLVDWRGVEAALAHLEDAVDRYPRSRPLHGLLVEVAAEAGPDRAAAAARSHLALHPDDDWCWRELGFTLAGQRLWDAARDAWQHAVAVAPGAMANDLLAGIIAAGRGDVPAAKAAFMAALRQSVDYAAAFSELLGLCDTRADRREALEFILGELKSQVIQGDTLQLFRVFARLAFLPTEAVQILREAHAARPDLWTTWAAVIEQLRSMDQLDEALAVAQEAVDRFPFLPGMRCQIAAVHRDLGRTADEIAALRHGLAINSRDTQILRELADAHGRNGEADAQRSMLERACASEPRDVSHRGALAECLWRQGQRDKAIAAIEAVILQQPLSEWAWSRLGEWAAISGQANLALDVAHAVVAQRPTSPQARLRLAEQLATTPGRDDDCWSTIQEALRLDPRSVDAHDLAAGFLAARGLFDEAIRACAPPVFHGRPPLRLQGRAAVIESQRGDLDEAIRRMQQLVEADPWYEFGWSQLATWWRQQGRTDEALAAARRLVEIAPRSALGWSTVAECLAQQGDTGECIRHLRRALEIDPSFQWAGQRLIELQAEAGEHAGALTTLAEIAPFLAAHEQGALEAWLQALAGRRAESLAALRRTVRHPAAAWEPAERAVDVMLRAGWAEDVKRELAAEVDGPRPPPLAAVALVEMLAREAAVASILTLIDALDETDAAWSRAVQCYLQAIGTARAHDLIDGFVQPRVDSLRRQTDSWAVVGSALHDADRLDEVIAWMGDWRERGDVQPHQLLPLVLALLQRDGAVLAGVVVDHALRMPLAMVTDALRVLGAVAEMMDDKPAAASGRLEAVAPRNLTPYYDFMLAILRETDEAIATLEGGGRWRDAWSGWRQAIAPRAGSADPLMNLVISTARLRLHRYQWNPFRTAFARWQLRRAIARCAALGRREPQPRWW